MQLLNTKVLLVIATLLASIVGLLVHQNRLTEQAQAKKEAAVAAEKKHDEDFWNKVSRYQQADADALKGNHAQAQGSPAQR